MSKGPLPAISPGDLLRARHWRVLGLVLLGAILGGGLGYAEDAAALPSVPDNAAAPDCVVRSWQTEQGLPHNAVNAIIQSKVGYLWLGTTDGLACFDGVRFTVFGVGHGLRSAHVRVLLEDSWGQIWIGTRGGGLSRYYQGEFTTYTQHDGLPSDDVEALMQDAAGRIWVGLRGGVATVSNPAPPDKTAQKGRTAAGAPLIRTLPQFQGRLMTALGQDRDGRLWLGGYGAGLFRVENGVVTRMVGPGEPDPFLECHSLIFDRSGRLWVAAEGDSVFTQQPAGWEQHRVPGRVKVRFVRSLAEAPDGGILAGSVSAGLFEFRAGSTEVTDLTRGLGDKAVESVLVDKEGTVWVGTQRGGLSQLCPRKVECYDERWGLGQVAVLSIAEVGGSLWATTLGQGVQRLAGRTFGPAAPSILSPFPYANPLLVARDGTCWLGTGIGLLHLTPEGQAVSGETNLPRGLGSAITALVEDRHEGLWLGTASGQLWRFCAGILSCQTNITSAQELSAIAQHPDGTLWVGSAGNGLIRLRGEQATHFGRAEGLRSSFIRTLRFDQAGTLWIGTVGGGLSRWKNGHIATFTTREGLLDDTVSQILEDDPGFLWLGCNRGLMRVSKQHLEDLTAGRVASVYPLFLGRGEGVSGECTGGYQPAGLKTRSGGLAFGTTKGIVLVDPIRFGAALPPPQVLLEKIVIDGEVAADFAQLNPAPELGATNREPPSSERPQAPAALQVAPGQHRYEFHFTGLSFTFPEWVRFRYRLEGLQREWTDAGRERVAEYFHVPAGRYRFRVLACNSEGTWNEAGATVAFVVKPHLWQRLWFQALAGFAGLFFLWGTAFKLTQRRHRMAMARADQQRLLELERSRIARDIHDQLGASLTRISLLSDAAQREVDRPEQVGVHLNKVCATALEAVQAMDAIVWAVNPRNDTLQSLVEYLAHLQNELFDETPTRCRLDLPADLPALTLSPHVRHNLFLVAREALHNVLKHAHASEVTLRIAMGNHSLRLMVVDDGRGFEVNPAGKGVAHTGLDNMRRRVEALRGQIRVVSAPGKGTAVHVSVPLGGGVTAPR